MNEENKIQELTIKLGIFQSFLENLQEYDTLIKESIDQEMLDNEIHSVKARLEKWEDEIPFDWERYGDMITSP